MAEETWLDAVPEDIRGSMAKFDDVGSLAKGYMELEAFRGKSLTIPGDEASAGDQQAFYDKVMEKVPGLVRKPMAEDAESYNAFWTGMGRPENADGYAAIEGMTPDQTQFMRDAALKANLTGDQFKEFAGVFTERSVHDAQAATDAAQAELETIYQGLGPSKDQKLQAVNNLALQLEMDASLQDFQNPAVLSLMLKLVDKVGSEGQQLQEQIGDNATMIMTPAEAEMKIGEVMNDPAYMDASDPRHKLLQKRVVELMAYKNPQASTTMASQRVGHGSLAAGTKDTIF